MAPKTKDTPSGDHITRSKGGAIKGKSKAQTRSDKAGLTMSVSKVHNHLLKYKRAKGVARVSVSAPVWITAAIEYFAAELLEQAGNFTVNPKQQGGSRKRITAEDITHALRADKELDKAMTGFRIVVGDKIKGDKIQDALLTQGEKDERDKRREAAKAAREAAKAAAGN